MKQLKAQKKKSETPDTKSKDKEIAELKQKVKQLEKAQKGRKLSALNRFKKYIVGPLTELALAETEYVDLIPLDKNHLWLLFKIKAEIYVKNIVEKIVL